jgi:hypothetical protein
MDSLQFAYWLRGFFEINGETALTKEQSEVISKHLTLVFEQRAIDLPPISFIPPADMFKVPPQPTEWPSIPGITITCDATPAVTEERWDELDEVRKFMDSCELPTPITTGSTTTDLVEDYIKAMDKIRAVNPGPSCTTVSCMSARYC